MTDPQAPSADRREEVLALQRQARKIARQIATDHFGSEPMIAFPFENRCQELIFAALRDLDAQSAERTRAEKVAWVAEQNRLLKALGAMGGALDAARAEVEKMREAAKQVAVKRGQGAASLNARIACESIKEGIAALPIESPSR